MRHICRTRSVAQHSNQYRSAHSLITRIHNGIQTTTQDEKLHSTQNPKAEMQPTELPGCRNGCNNTTQMQKWIQKTNQIRKKMI
jgi:uncharacterized protein YkwD